MNRPIKAQLGYDIVKDEWFAQFTYVKLNGALLEAIVPVISGEKLREHLENSKEAGT